MALRTKILTKRYGLPNSWTLEVAEANGAYSVAKRMYGTTPTDQVKAEMKAANVRGRGGAGFPAGVKWGFVAPVAGKPTYLVVNADEGEPGTFKDRTIMEQDPHGFIEGCMLACWAIGAHTAYIFVRGELYTSIRRLEQAIRDCNAKGYLGARPFGRDHALQIHVHPGAGAYICGEETALLNALEGRRGEPRLKPPFPAVAGAFGAPTLVNNVETIWAVPTVLEMGGEKFSQLSRLHDKGDGGVRLYGVSGHVKTPGIYEAPVGLTMRELIYDPEFGGGMLFEDRPLKGVIPGGSSTPILHPNDVVKGANDDKHPLFGMNGKSQLDVPMGVDTYRAIGTMLGTCGAIVMDTTVNMVEVSRNLMKFYHHESCGQCTPCREGSGWLVDTLNKICEGRGTAADVDLIVSVSNNMMGTTICALSEGTAMPMLGLLFKYRSEFLEAAGKGVGDARLDSGVQKLVRGAA